ncbi:MAG: hypothetical protein GX868_13585, partial [Actinobacteria bacterium]|nr:hypothetical protein [Actinomycetota bacterium]
MFDRAAGEDENNGAGGDGLLTVGELVQTLTDARLMLAMVMSELDPREIPIAAAPEVLSAFVGVERLAANGRVLMAARAAQATEWKQGGFASPEDWLANQQGTSASRARGDLETSNRLKELEKT